MNWIADLVGWIGNVGFIVGAIALSKKSIVGFHWQILGNAMYLIQAIVLGISSLIILSILLIMINIGGIINWKRNAHVSNQSIRT